jgi:hypothetical protein
MPVTINNGKTPTSCTITGSCRAWRQYDQDPYTNGLSTYSGASSVSSASLGEFATLSLSRTGYDVDWEDRDEDGWPEPYNGVNLWGWSITTSTGVTIAAGVARLGSLEWAVVSDEWSPDIFELAAYDSSCNFSVSISYEWDRMCEWDFWSNPRGGVTCEECPPLWCNFPEGDAGWVPAAKALYTYRLASIPVVTYNIGGMSGSVAITPQLWNNDPEWSGDVDTWMHGFENGGVMSVSWGYGGEILPAGKVQPGQIFSVSTARGGWSSLDATPKQWSLVQDINNELRTVGRMNLSGSTFTMHDYGNSKGLIMSMTLEDQSGSVVVDFSGGARRVDGEEKEGAIFHTGESEMEWVEDFPWPNQFGHWAKVNGDGTDIATDGTSASVTYQGWWVGHLHPSNDNEWPAVQGPNIHGWDLRLDDIPTFDYSTLGKYRTHGPMYVTNCQDIDEPYFLRPGDTVLPAISDSRIPIRLVSSPPVGFEDAYSLGVKASHKVFDFGDVESFSGCTVTPVTGGVEILCNDAGGYVEFTTPDHLSFQGARYAKVNYTADPHNSGTDDPVTVTLQGREFRINTSNDTVDFLCPDNYGGVEITQSIIDAIHPNTPADWDHPELVWNGPWDYDTPWGWGIHFVNQVRVSGMEAGKTYTFTDITLRRLSPWRLLVYPQTAWTGNSGQVNQPQGGLNDFQEMYGDSDLSCRYAGKGGTTTHPANCWVQVKGYLIVDGLVVGGIISNKYIQTWYESNLECPLPWSIELPNVNNEAGLNVGEYSLFPSPLNGFVTLESAGDDNALIAFLKPGTYSGGETPVDIDCELWYDFAHVPVRWPSLSLSGTKTFSAQALVRVIDENKSNLSDHSFYITSRDRTDELVELLPGGADWRLTPACSQLDGLNVRVKDYAPDPGDPLTLEADIELRNRHLSLVVLKGKLSAPTSLLDTDILMCLNTICQVAYTTGAGELYAARSHDLGKTLTGHTLVTDTGTPQRPCLIDDRTEGGYTGLLWTEGSNIKLAWSADGFVTSGVSTLSITGLTNVRAKTHPVDGVLVLAGWRSSDGKIVSAHSFDNGVNWSALAEVVTVPEQAFGLAYAATDAGHWIVTCMDAGGVLRTYWSTDHGQVWQLAS